MLSFIKRNRQKFLKESIGSDKRKFYSPISFSQYKITIPLILKNVKGNLLDIGCGDLHYKRYIKDKVDNYDSIDIKRKSNDVKFEGNIQNMIMIKDNTYDSAICLEVLEHVPNPFLALKEINRILKKDSVLIISVPHLSRLHEEPYDFFRYTKYGLATMLDSTGFIVNEIIPIGGIFSFFGHQLSSVLISIFYGIPVINDIVFLINKLLIVRTCAFLDKHFDKTKRLASGYTCLVKKR